MTDIKICCKCLEVQPTNIVNRKYRGKWMQSTTHQCRRCGSYTFLSGGGRQKKASDLRDH